MNQDIGSRQSEQVQGAAPAEKEQIKEAVARLVEGTGFVVEELEHELVITNPNAPENGQLHVDFELGYVGWERVVWDFWGAVAEGLGEEGAKVVTREMVEGVLG